jgi:Na+/proline symporter
MTMDIWRQIRKNASQAELMRVGRITVLILVYLSIVWIPILEEAQGGLFWFYLQAIRSYLLPPMCVLFLLSFFWKRLTEQVRNLYVISKGLGAIWAKIGPTSNVDKIFSKIYFQYVLFRNKYR